MMKKQILLMMIILFLPLVYSLYGGDTWKYHFDKCNNFEVNITAIDKIDEGEYEILNNCTKNGINYYICDCTDDYYFNVTFHNGAVNNYTFNFNYNYDELKSEPSGSSGGGLGSSVAFTIRFLNNQSRILMLTKNIISIFWINGVQHTIKPIGISNNSVMLEITSSPINVTLQKDEPKQIELDNETLEMTLTTIRGNVVFIEFEKIQKEVTKKIEKEEINESIEPTKEEFKSAEEPQKEVTIELSEEEKKASIGSIIVLLIVFVGLIIYYLINRKKLIGEG